MQPVAGAVIAAAGLGSRLGLGIPKCMIEVHGRPLLGHMVRALEPLVPRIHVVIGYRETLVAEYCAAHHRNVVLVRNPAYKTTTTGQSMALGAAGQGDKLVFMDGDLLIEPASLSRFIKQAAEVDVLMALSDASTDNAVFVQATPAMAADTFEVNGFQRQPTAALEWANVVAGPRRLLDGSRGYVFERLNDLLPLQGYKLNLAEADTQEDLARLLIFADQVGLLPGGGIDTI